MRTKWKLTVALLLGVGVTALAKADPDNPPPRPGSTSIFNQMLRPNSAPPPPQKKPPVNDAKKAPPKPTVDPLAKIRAQELANCLRRTEVCLKLMQVADETNDEALRKKAEELDRRVRAAYKKRMAELADGADEDMLVKPAKPKPNRESVVLSTLEDPDETAEKVEGGE
jgi:hypothetical protein